jgi:hypothetical protein
LISYLRFEKLAANVSLVKVAINCSQTNTKIPKRLKEKHELKNKIYSRKHADKNQAKAIVTNGCYTQLLIDKEFDLV